MQEDGREASNEAKSSRLAQARDLGVETVTEWLGHRGPERGAALAFYVILSLGPLLALLVGVLELLAAGGTIQPAVVQTVQRFGGDQAAATAQTVLASADPPNLLSPASLLTVATLVFAATAAFANVRGALQEIWGIPREAESVKRQILEFLHTRWRGFLMIGITGLLVIASFLITSLATLLYELLTDFMPLGLPVVRALDVTVSILILGLMFGVVFRTLPGVRVEWSSILLGAFGTATLFVVGKLLVTPFFSIPAWTSYYGPGTSVVVFLAWVYFSAQIFFLGAEFTRVWSRHKGGRLDWSHDGVGDT